MRPIAACAMVVVERTRVSQVTPESPGIPRAMVLRLMARSPRGTGLSSPRRFAGRARQNLTPASGCRDHTLSPSALLIARHARRKRPSHPAPNVRGDCAYAPLEGQDARIRASDLPDGASGNFAMRGGGEVDRLESLKELSPLAQATQRYRRPRPREGTCNVCRGSIFPQVSGQVRRRAPGDRP